MRTTLARAVLVGLLLAGSCKGNEQLSEQGSDPTLSIAAAEERCRAQQKELPRGRCEAAVEDLRAHIRRIELARESFAQDLESAPSEPREYLLSFERRVSVEALLTEIASHAEIELLTLHLWMATPGSEDAPTGSVSADSLGWPGVGAEEAAKAVAEQGQDYLETHVENLESGSGAVVQEQLREGRLALEALHRDGSVSYGLQCICTPESLMSLEEAVPDLALRAVERANPNYQQPIWLEDVLRERIIESGGTYGRSY